MFMPVAQGLPPIKSQMYELLTSQLFRFQSTNVVYKGISVEHSFVSHIRR